MSIRSLASKQLRSGKKSNDFDSDFRGRGTNHKKTDQKDTLRKLPLIISPMREPELNNDFINMSGINVLATLYPQRPVNQAIMQKYRQDYEKRQEASNNPEMYRKMKREQEDEENNYIGAQPTLTSLEKRNTRFEGASSALSKVDNTSFMMRTLSNFHSLDPTKVQPPKTIYYSFLEGQLSEAKPQVDNLSQCESFFKAVNDTIMFSNTKTPQHYPKKFKQNLLLLSQSQSPNGKRRKETMTLTNRPKPPTPVYRVIEEDVNQEHTDSSDDDFHQDEKFKATSYKIAQSAIDNLPDYQIEALNKQILLQKYEKGLKDWKKHRLDPQTLYNKLDAEPKITSTRMVYGDDENDVDDKKSMINQSILFQSGLSFAGMSSNLRNRKGLSTLTASKNGTILDKKGINYNKFSTSTTKKKLIKENLTCSKKQLELQGASVHDTRPISNEEWRRTGFPQVKKFYTNLKKVERLIEHKLHEKKGSIAYMAKASKLPIIPGPMGIVSRKGKNKIMDLTNRMAGNQQAKAIGEAVKVTNASTLRFSNNRFNSKGVGDVIKNLNGSIAEIDLSGNTLQDYNRKKELKLRQLVDIPSTAIKIVKNTDNKFNLQYHYRKPKPTLNNSVDDNLPEMQVVIPEETQEDGDSDAANPSSDCVQRISKYLQQSEKYNISSLILNRCRLGDDGVNLIVNSMLKSSNARVMKLYLNENNIGNLAAVKLAEMLNDPIIKLRELGLRWNIITAIGGNAIANSLETNDQLKILDLGWNSIGVRPPKTKIKATTISPGKVGQCWGAAFNKNQSLVHLDLCFNKIELEETIILAQDLKWNHTLVGLHYQGNMGKLDPEMGKVDSLGFVQMLEASQINPRDTHLHKGLTDGTTRLKFYLQKEKIRAGSMAEVEWAQGAFKDQSLENDYEEQSSVIYKNINSLQLQPKVENCWICHAWVECIFEIDLVQMLKHHGKEIQISDNLEDVVYQVFIHFDFDDYQPDRMDDLRNFDIKQAGSFRLYRMVPQGKFHYFYSFENQCYLDDRKVRVPLLPRSREKILCRLSQEGRHEGVNIKEFNLIGLNMINTIPMATEIAIEDHKRKIEDRDSDSEENEEVINLPLGQEYTSQPSQLNTQQPSDSPNILNIKGKSTLQLNTFNNNIVQSSFQSKSRLNHELNMSNLNMLNTTSEESLMMGKTSVVNFATTIESIYESNTNSQPNLQVYQQRTTRVPPIERPEYSILDMDTYKLKLKYCEIRPDKNLGPRKERAKTPWTVELGLFKDYLKEEKKELDQKCFEEDWKNMKQPRYKASEEADIKVEMRKVYSNLRTMYRVQSGYSPAGNVFSVGPTQISMFLSDVIACLDRGDEAGGRLKAADQGRILAAITSKRAVELPSQYNPPAQLIRCQFLELVIRCAIEKYMASGKVDNELDAVKIFNKEFLIKQISVPQIIWRRRHTFTQRVDIVMRAYKKHLDNIYGRFSGKHTDPGSKPLMEADEFEAFCQSSGLINDSFVQREVGLVFNLSMFTQIDEVNKGRHLSANSLEFLEMVCRAADEASYPPPVQAKNDEAGGVGQTEETVMTFDERLDQPLHIKLLNCLPTIINNCCDRKFLNNPKNKPVVDFGPAEEYNN